MCKCLFGSHCKNQYWEIAHTRMHFELVLPTAEFLRRYDPWQPRFLCHLTNAKPSDFSQRNDTGEKSKRSTFCFPSRCLFDELCSLVCVCVSRLSGAPRIPWNCRPCLSVPSSLVETTTFNLPFSWCQRFLFRILTQFSHKVSH